MGIKVEVFRNNVSKMTEWKFQAFVLRWWYSGEQSYVPVFVPSQKHWFEQPFIYKNTFARAR